MYTFNTSVYRLSVILHSDWFDLWISKHYMLLGTSCITTCCINLSYLSLMLYVIQMLWTHAMYHLSSQTCVLVLRMDVWHGHTTCVWWCMPPINYAWWQSQLSDRKSSCAAAKLIIKTVMYIYGHYEGINLIIG